MGATAPGAMTTGQQAATGASSLFGTLASAYGSMEAGKTAKGEAKVSMAVDSLQAKQREVDRKEALLRALASQNAMAGASGVGLEGTPSQIMMQDIEAAKKAQARDTAGTRISGIAKRARGDTAYQAGRMAAMTTLLEDAPGAISDIGGLF